MTTGELRTSVIAFCCENSALQAVEDARHFGMTMPECVQTIRVPCAGKVEEDHILKALESGAAGVVLFACHTENCQYLQGNVRAEKRLTRLRGLLDEIGYPADAVLYASAAPAEAARAARILRTFADDLASVDREEAIEQ